MDFQENFCRNTTEMIRQELNKVLRIEKGEDDVWIVNCDRMKNYKGYFASDNPCMLVEKFKVEQRLDKLFSQKLKKQVDRHNLKAA